MLPWQEGGGSEIQVLFPLNCISSEVCVNARGQEMHTEIPKSNSYAACEAGVML